MLKKSSVELINYLLHKQERDTRQAMMHAIENRQEEGLQRKIAEYQLAYDAVQNFDACALEITTKEEPDGEKTV